MLQQGGSTGSWELKQFCTLVSFTTHPTMNISSFKTEMTNSSFWISKHLQRKSKQACLQACFFLSTLLYFLNLAPWLALQLYSCTTIDVTVVSAHLNARTDSAWSPSPSAASGPSGGGDEWMTRITKLDVSLGVTSKGPWMAGWSTFIWQAKYIHRGGFPLRHWPFREDKSG